MLGPVGSPHHIVGLAGSRSLIDITDERATWLRIVVTRHKSDSWSQPQEYMIQPSRNAVQILVNTSTKKRHKKLRKLVGEARPTST